MPGNGILIEVFIYIGCQQVRKLKASSNTCHSKYLSEW